MSLFKKALVLISALSMLLFLAACGGSSPKVVPPPSGGFSNSNLNGTYVFSVSGSDVVNGTFFAAIGTLVANGSGGLTGGSFDFIDPASGVSTSNTVSGGTYQVGMDGRGTATLPGNLGLDFVLTSSSHGLVIRFDGNGTGSGTLDLQGATTAPTGSYSFSLAGVDNTGLNPFNSVGSFTLDSTGVIVAGTGVQDFNDHYTISSETGLTALPLSGSVISGANGAVLTTGSTFGTLTFDVFPVDSTHLKLVETDGIEFLAGDAFTQQTNMPAAGQLVFTMAGFDVNQLFFAAGGFLTSDGTSQITTGLEDINDGGSVAQTIPTLSNFSSTGNGRFTVTLNGIFNGSASVGSYTFAAYPTQNGGIQLLEIDGSGITSGTMYAQTSTSLSTPQGYGLDLTGADSSGNEVDEIAEFTAQNGGVSGIADINDGGSLSVRQGLGDSSTYTLDTPATGRGEVSTSQFGLVFYVVDSSNVIFIETDSSPVGLGTFQLQNASGTLSAQSTISMHHASARPGAVRLPTR
jgi:hypothetical protein